MASEPLFPAGIPTFEPGWDEITIPEPLLLPPSILGGARAEPASPGPPSPEPFLPEPESPVVEPIEGGGGTTLPASASLPEPRRLPAPVDETWLVPEPPTEGGGGITFDAPRDEPEALPEAEVEPPTDGGGGTTLVESEPFGAPARVRPVPEALPEETFGGGGTTLLASEPPVFPGALRAGVEALDEETVGGGATTSCVPKSLPITLLTNDPLACVGGGGTTDLEGSALPLSRRRMSCAESAEGGGATTAGAGRLSLEFRRVSRSGAETGGGTTEALFICTRVDETSWPVTAGAGGITLAFSAGVERAWSREMRVDAGPITVASKDGAARV
jgi:hypothetical protein